MKTKLKKDFLDELKRVPIIQVACDKVGISRQTFYRWKKESKEFAKVVDDSLKEGVAFVNDMSETQLLNLIKDKDYKAISFWLRHRNDNYKNKIEITNGDDNEELTSEQKKVVRDALRLAAVIKTDSINKLKK
jgi:ACT domain-containing protein